MASRNKTRTKQRTRETCLATALKRFCEDIHHLILADERHNQEVEQPDGRYEGLHHAEGKAEQDGHGMVRHLRAEAHVLVLPQPLARASSGRKTRLDVVEEEADETQEADGLGGKGLQTSVKRRFVH